MADPRSSFRFRMPRLRPSVPPPRSTTRTTTRRPSSQPEPPTTPIPPPASTTTVPPPPSPPILPQGIPPPPTSPATPPVLSQPAPTATPVPTPFVQPPPPPGATVPAPPPSPPPPVLPPPAPTTTVPPPTAIAPTPFVLPPPPPPQEEPRSMPPPPPSSVASSFTKPATTKSPKPTKTESQPSSPSQTSIQSRVSSQPPSPSRMSNEPRVSAKPPLPSTTPQPPFPTNIQPSQPTSPSPLDSENKITSLPPSPIINTPKLQPKEASSSSSLSDISSDNDQKNVDLALVEQPRIEAPKVEEKHKDAINTTSNNIPKTPKTKSMISQPESPQIPKPINRSEALTDVNDNDTSPRKQFSNEKPLSVITLAGDNRGTSMLINGAIKRERKIHIHRKYKVDNLDEIEDTTTDGEESSNGKKLEKDSEPTENLDKNAYINCNIQGINNSMVFNSSFVERNPGVHLGRNPNNVNKSKRKKSKPTDMTNSSQKITTIRRRCLRGIFMESSDSDADDPQKPRRHGCRYTGGEKSNKEEKMDVV